MFLCVVAATSYSDTIILDFGDDFNDPTINENGGMHLTDVATGINASLVASAPWVADYKDSDPTHGVKHGSLAFGVDCTIPGQAVLFTLTLYNALHGDGFTELYSPGQDYDWSLCFFDIDNYGARYDSVTLRTEGTYTITETSALDVDNSVDGQVTFSGQNVAGVGSHNDGMIQNQAEADAAVVYDVSNTSTLEFIFTATGADKYRAGLLDGGTLSTVMKDNYLTETHTVPEPTTMSLFGIVGVLGFFLRRRLSLLRSRFDFTNQIRS